MTSEVLKRDYVEAYIKQSPGCSLKDLRTAFTGTKQALWQHVVALKSEGKVSSYGVGKAAVYFPQSEFWTPERSRICSVAKPESVRIVAGYAAKNSPVTHMDVVKQTGLQKSVAFRAFNKLESVDIVANTQGRYLVNDGPYLHYTNILRNTGCDPSKYEFQRQGEPSLPKLPDQKERILQAIYDRPGLTMKEYAVMLGLGETTVEHHQKGLFKEGKVQRVRWEREYHIFPQEQWVSHSISMAGTLPVQTRKLYLLTQKVLSRVHSENV